MKDMARSSMRSSQALFSETRPFASVTSYFYSSLEGTLEIIWHQRFLQKKCQTPVKMKLTSNHPRPIAQHRGSILWIASHSFEALSSRSSSLEHVLSVPLVYGQP